MTRSTKRYAGPPPRCPDSLDDVPPQLTVDQLEVPTSELYSVALEEFWRGRQSEATQAVNGNTKGKARESKSQGMNAGEEEADEVERYEPDPSKPERPTPRHYGLYARERSTLDWTYHVVPTKARQSLQDEIVSLVLGTQVKECKDAGDDELCRVSGTGQAELGCQLGDCSGESDDGKPLALFTAG